MSRLYNPSCLGLPIEVHQELRYCLCTVRGVCPSASMSLVLKGRPPGWELHDCGFEVLRVHHSSMYMWSAERTAWNS